MNPSGVDADTRDERDLLPPVSVLLVDDRVENLVALKAILDSADYRLVTALSGEAALRALLREDFAIVFLDVVMPTMDGFEVANHMKQIERTRRIPIVFLTAVATDISQIYKAYSIGAVDYLIKPLDARAVRSKAAVFADLYRQRREIERQSELLRESDRREHELRLAGVRVASDKRYRKLVEGIDHAIGWSMTAALELTFVSNQLPRVLGYSVTQYAEPGFWVGRIPPEDRAAVLEAFRRAMEERRDQTVDHRIVTADGRAAWFRTGVSVVEDANGTPELHGISVDVTQIKDAVEEARAAMRAREGMLAIVSHDLRNPLSSIRLGAEKLRQLPHDDAAGKTLDTIYRAAKRMERLVSDLIDFEQIRLDRLRVDKHPQSVTSLVADAVDVLEPSAREKGVTLATELDAVESVEVLCDRERVLQVVSNIGDNAIKFSPAGGRVTIRVERAEEMVRFAVTDSGTGLSGEDLPHVFERFWQSNAVGGGLGLGLAIAKGIVETHDGTIGVESKPGEGCTFLFTLPVAKIEQSSRSSGSTRARSRRRESRR